MSRLVPDWLVDWAAHAPDRLAVRATSFTWSYRELAAAADALATALARSGAQEGTPVAALLADDAPAVALVHAARRLGAVLVPLNRRAATPELAGQLGQARVTVVVHDDAHAARAAELAAGGASTLLAVEPVLSRPPTLLSEGALRSHVDLDAPATVVFTSGTTGHPKGAVLSYANHLASADAWADALEPRPDDRWLACLPLFHVAGLAIIVRTCRWGVPVEVVDRFVARQLADRLEEGVSHVSLVPTQLRQLLEVISGRPSATASWRLRSILLGGGPIPDDLLARARSAGLPVLTTYGLTETASGIAVGGGDQASLVDPTALRPLRGVSLRIAGADGAGVGQVQVRGPMVFGGYLGDSTATAERLRDGWLDTGDVGRLDGEGCLHIVDRRDDLFVSGGENVSPAEVEGVLCEHPGIVDAAVLGQPDPTWGSVPVAAIVMATGSSISDATLERHCRERLSGYKVPVRFHRLATLPRNASGKIMRRELRDALLEDPA